MRPGYYDYVVAAHQVDPRRTASDLARGFGVHVNTVETILRDAADRGVAIRRLPRGALCKYDYDYDREAVLDALARDLTVPLSRIAQALGLPKNSVKNIFDRARRKGDPRAAPRPCSRSARFGRGARA